MNVLFVTSATGRGGGEVWLSQISRSLAGRGHRVTIVHNPSASLSSLFESKPDSLKIELIPLRLGGDLDPFVIGSLYRLIRSRNISLVCTNMEKDLRLAGIAAMVAGVPVIPSREIDEPIADSRINRYFYSHVASGVMVNSHATMNTMIHNAPWLKASRMHIVWKGIDTARWNTAKALPLREQLGFAATDRIAGFAGKLDEQKGLPTLLEASRRAIPIAPDLKMVIAGEGNMLQMAEEFIRRHNLERNIKLIGFCADIPGFMKAIDFLVMPSYWEGFGYSAVEAMASGRAVIGTWCSSLAEVIADGKTGILVPPRSAEDLAAAIVSLANDPGLCVTLGNAGNERARKMFSLQQMVNATEQVFLSVIEQHRRDQRGANGAGRSAPTIAPARGMRAARGNL